MSEIPLYEALNDSSWEEVEELKIAVGWRSTAGSARAWWNAFEKESITNVPMVKKVLEELVSRSSSIQQFFLAYVYNDTENIQATLDFLDEVRAKAAGATPTVEDFIAASKAATDNPTKPE